MKPRVTIGICARNAESTIKNAIISVLNQNYPHDLLEVILVDDGSKDSTLEIMTSFASKKEIDVKIFSGKWRGLGKARNTVIRNSSCDYIVWLDSDEVIERDFIQKHVSILEEDPRIGIVSSTWGIPSGANPILALELLPSVVESTYEARQRQSKLPGTGGTTYRVAAAKQVGNFNETITAVGEDIDLALRVRNAGWRIVSSDAIFYESHGRLSTWSGLWRKYVNQGKQGRRLYYKTPGFYSVSRINPIASFIVSIFYAINGYRITQAKLSFLLPLHFTFKMTAWFYGFSKR